MKCIRVPVIVPREAQHTKRKKENPFSLSLYWLAFVPPTLPPFALRLGSGRARCSSAVSDAASGAAGAPDAEHPQSRLVRLSVYVASASLCASVSDQCVLQGVVIGLPAKTSVLCDKKYKVVVKGRYEGSHCKKVLWAASAMLLEASVLIPTRPVRIVSV